MKDLKEARGMRNALLPLVGRSWRWGCERSLARLWR